MFFYHQNNGLDYTILRYANIYGPRQNPHGEAGVVAIFTEKILKGEDPIIIGDGLQSRDYVFVEDVVKANELVLNSGNGKIYNLGTGIETDVNELFNKIVNTIGKNVPEKHGPAKPGEQKRSVLSSDLINNDFGWKPSIQMDVGIKKTVEFFKNKLKRNK